MHRRSHRILAGVDVRSGPDSEIELLAFTIEEHRPRPVPFVEALQRHNLLAGRRGLHRCRVVLVSLQRCRFGDVEIVFPQRQAVGPIEPVDDLVLLVDFAVGVLVAEHVHAPAMLARATAVGHQDLVARTEQHEPRRLEAIGRDVDGKSRRNLDAGAIRLGNNLGPIIG